MATRDRFEISSYLQLYLKTVSSRSTRYVPEIQNYNGTDTVVVHPGDADDPNLNKSLLFSANAGANFEAYGAHVDGSSVVRLTISGVW